MPKVSGRATVQFNLLTRIALMVVLIGVVLSCRSTSVGFQSREPANIRVVINQLPDKDGVIPIEIIQPNVISSAPNKLDDLTYIFRNNSAKAVIATAVIRTITYEERGKVYADSAHSTSDSAFHSDMPGRPLLPGTQMSMGSPGPLSFSEGVVIKEVTLTLEYVSYDDHTAHGSGGVGERIINTNREGARRFKSWLAQEYSRAGESLTAIFPLIQASGLPEGFKVEPDLTMGADRYRLHLLRTLKTKGAADVESYLKQNQ
jgi:hypothetical protein